MYGIIIQEGDAEMSSEYSDNDIDDDMAPHCSDDGSESHKDSETIVNCRNLYDLSMLPIALCAPNRTQTWIT